MTDMYPDTGKILVTVTLCKNQVSKWFWRMKAEENYFCCTNDRIGTQPESSQFYLKSSCHTAQGRTQQFLF